MPYRVVFWKPKPGINPFLPYRTPLGAQLVKEVREGTRSELLIDWDVAAFLAGFLERFPDAKRDGDGLYWKTRTSRPSTSLPGSST